MTRVRMWTDSGMGTNWWGQWADPAVVSAGVQQVSRCQRYRLRSTRPSTPARSRRAAGGAARPPGAAPVCRWRAAPGARACPRRTVGPARSRRAGATGSGPGRDVAVGRHPAGRDAGDDVEHALGQFHVHGERVNALGLVRRPGAAEVTGRRQFRRCPAFAAGPDRRRGVVAGHCRWRVMGSWHDCKRRSPPTRFRLRRPLRAAGGDRADPGAAAGDRARRRPAAGAGRAGNGQIGHPGRGGRRAHRASRRCRRNRFWC